MQLMKYQMHEDHPELMDLPVKRRPKLRNYHPDYPPWAGPPYDIRVIESLIIASRQLPLTPYPADDLHWLISLLSRGVAKRRGCQKCKKGDGLFTKCIKLEEGWFNGCCANCKRQDKGAQCEVRDEDKSEFRPPPQIKMGTKVTKRGRKTKAPVSYKPIDARKSNAVQLEVLKNLDVGLGG